MGILAGHAALLSALGKGTLTYVSGGAPAVVQIDGGFVEVFENKVSVLADSAQVG
jgi:F-type H+-transporting ATPase subunit epsilon